MEAETGMVKLIDVSPATFEFFVQWVYTRSLVHEDLTPAPTGQPKDMQHPIAFYLLIRLWHLAGFLGAERLRNQILLEVAYLADKTNSVPGAEDIKVLWGGEGSDGGGDDGNKLRDLVGDLYVGKKTEGLIWTCEDSWYVTFLSQFIVIIYFVHVSRRFFGTVCVKI